MNGTLVFVDKEKSFEIVDKDFGIDIEKAISVFTDGQFVRLKDNVYRCEHSDIAYQNSEWYVIVHMTRADEDGISDDEHSFAKSKEIQDNVIQKIVSYRGHNYAM
jgi:hypothetical protein